MAAGTLKRAAVVAALLAAVPAAVGGAMIRLGVVVTVPRTVSLVDAARLGSVAASVLLAGLLVWVAWGLRDVQAAQADLQARQRLAFHSREASNVDGPGDDREDRRTLAVQYMPVVNVLDWHFEYREAESLVSAGYQATEAALLASLDVVEVTLSNTGNGMATGLTVDCSLEVIDGSGTAHDVADAGVQVRSAPLTRAERFELHSFASHGESLGPREQRETFAGPLYAVRDGDDGPEVRTVSGVLEEIADAGRAERVRATFALEYSDVVGNVYRLEATPVEAPIDDGPRLGEVVERSGGGLNWQQVRSPQLSEAGGTAPASAD